MCLTQVQGLLSAEQRGNLTAISAAMGGLKLEFGRACEPGVDYAAYGLVAMLDPAKAECFQAPTNVSSLFPDGLCFPSVAPERTMGACKCVPAPTPQPTVSPPSPGPTAAPSELRTVSPTSRPSSQPTASPTVVAKPAVTVRSVQVRFFKGVALIPGLPGGGGPRLLDPLGAVGTAGAGRGKFLRGLQSGQSDLASISAIPFQIAFRCLWAFLINDQLRQGNGTVEFDYLVKSAPAYSVVEFIPDLDFDPACASASTDAGRVCTVDFAIAKVPPPTPAPTAAPTTAPTAQPSAAPSARPSEAPSARPTAQPTAPPGAKPTPKQVGRRALPDSATNDTRVLSLSYFIAGLLKGVQGDDPNRAARLYTFNTGLWFVDPTNSYDNLDSIRALVNDDGMAASSYLTRFTAEEIRELEGFKIEECPASYPAIASTAPAAPKTVNQVLLIALPSVVALGLLLVGLMLWRARKRRALLRRKADAEAAKASTVAPQDGQEDGMGSKRAAAGGSLHGFLKGLQIDTSRLALGAVIGHGANGRIFRATYCDSDVAVKELFPQVLQGGKEGEDALPPRDSMWREVRNLRMLRHPNVIQLYGCAQALSEDSGQWRFLVVMELATCSLRDLLQEEQAKRRQPEPAQLEKQQFLPLQLHLHLQPPANHDSAEHAAQAEQEEERALLGVTAQALLPFPILSDPTRLLLMCKEVCAGLAYIHDCNMIHFDIKPENILLNQAGQVKICDLGIAKLHAGPNRTMHMTKSELGGTPGFMAPELLRGSMEQVGTAVDVYAFGLVLWQVLHPLKPPHPPHWSFPKLMHEVMVCDYRPELDLALDPQLATLVRRCWDADPRVRPSFHDALRTVDDLLARHAPSRSRFYSEDSLDFLLKVGAKAFFWEHLQRRFVPCTVEARRGPRDARAATAAASGLLVDLRLEKDDVIFRGVDPALLVRFNVGGEEDLGTDAALSSAAASGEDGAGPEDPDSDEGLENLATPLSTSQDCFWSAQDGDGPPPVPLRQALESRANQRRMLHRRAVPDLLVRVPGKAGAPETLQRECVFSSVALMAATHRVFVLRLNQSLFQSVQSTIQFRNAVHFAPRGMGSTAQGGGNEEELSLRFEDGPSLPSPSASSPWERGGGSDGGFETDKMSVCPYADLVPYRELDMERVSCSAGLHLPTFGLLAVKRVQTYVLDADEVAIKLCEDWDRLLCESAAAVAATPTRASSRNQPPLTPAALGHLSQGLSLTAQRIAARVTPGCPALAAFYGAYVDTNEQALCVLQEYMDGGSLQDVMDMQDLPDYVAGAPESLSVPSSPRGTGTGAGAGLDMALLSAEPSPSCQSQASRLSGLESFAGVDMDGVLESAPPIWSLGPTAVCDEAVLATVARSVLEALLFLHETGRAHLGVKPSNVLFDSAGQVKLADWGMFDPSWRTERPNIFHDVAYQAPEQLRHEPCGAPADVWGLMVTLLSAALGHHPFGYVARREVVSRPQLASALVRDLQRYGLRLPEKVPFPHPRALQEPTYDVWVRFSPQLSDFLDRGLQMNPARRDSAAKLLAHPWIAANALRVAPVRKGLAAEVEERLVADITNAVVLRVTASLESRRYLLSGSEDEASGDLLVRKQCVDRLAGQLCLAPQMVIDSFVFNAHQAGLVVRLKTSAKNAEMTEAPQRDDVADDQQQQQHQHQHQQHDEEDSASSASTGLSAADVRDSDNSNSGNSISESALTGLSAADGHDRSVSFALKRATEE